MLVLPSCPWHESEREGVAVAQRTSYYMHMSMYKSEISNIGFLNAARRAEHDAETVSLPSSSAPRATTRGR